MTNSIWDEYIKTVKKIRISNRKIFTTEHYTNPNKIVSINNFYNTSHTIDLHGLTQDQAFMALKRFLQNAYENRKKQITIITGKGKPNKPSVMKLEVPRWLQHTELSNLISKFDLYSEERESGKILVTLKKHRDI